jgi:hypothetical protein
MRPIGRAFKGICTRAVRPRVRSPDSAVATANAWENIRVEEEYFRCHTSERLCLSDLGNQFFARATILHPGGNLLARPPWCRNEVFGPARFWRIFGDVE